MKKLSLSNIGARGLSMDIPPWDLDPSSLTFGRNFRVYANYITTAGGQVLYGQEPELTTVYPGFIMFAGDTSNPHWIIAGRDQMLSFNGTNWSNITPVDFDALSEDLELEWDGTLLGHIPILTNYFSYPLYWEPPEGLQQLRVLPWDSVQSWKDVGWKARVIRSHKNFLFALGMQEGPTEFPQSYRWSHPADINGLPFTWDEEDSTSIAGVASIGSDFGPLVDGGTLRDSFVLYSENGINVLTESRDEFIWNRRPLVTSIGLLSPKCIVEVFGSHLFIGNGDILLNDGNTVTSLLHGRMRNQFNAQINPQFFNRSFAIRNVPDNEVWFCVPTESSEFPNLAYVYNYKQDAWTMRDLPENLLSAGYGPQGTPQPSWDSWEGTWDEQQAPWGTSRRTPQDGTVMGLIMTPTGSEIHVLDPRGPRDSGSLSSFIERTDLSLEGLDVATTIVNIYPKISGTSEVTIEIGSQKFAGGPVTWKPPRIFRPGVDRKVDIRTTGPLHAWRISSNVVGNWALSGIDLEYEFAGRR